MSVDFYHCEACSESRYEEYVGTCTSCGNSLCTSCVVNDDVKSDYAYEYGVRFDGTKEQMDEYGIEDGWYEIGDIIDDTSIDPHYCPFCQGEDFTEGMLLEFAIKKLGTTHTELVKEYVLNRDFR